MVPDLKVTFFPDDTHGNSPWVDLERVTTAKERTRIMVQLQIMAAQDLIDWPSKWVKKWGKRQAIYQLRYKSIRVHFVPVQGQLVVINVFVKKRQKTPTRDESRSEARYQALLQTLK